ncbi:MAG: hypothetical protein AB3N28_12870 [Kordiimonas sp.]
MQNLGFLIVTSIKAVIAAFVLTHHTLAAGQDDDCLTFGSPFISIKGLTNGSANFKIAMKEANICATFIKFPMGRYATALIEGRIDGIVFRVPAFKKILGDAGHMVPEPVISGTALLVSFDPTMTSLSALSDQPIGIRGGTVWTKKIVGNRANVIESSSYDKLVELLTKERVKALLVNSATAARFENELNGATQTVIGDLSVYTWLRSSLKHRSDEIAEAIRAYKAKGKTFLDPVTPEIS